MNANFCTSDDEEAHYNTVCLFVLALKTPPWVFHYYQLNSKFNLTQQEEAGVHLITHMWLSSDLWDQSVVKNTSHLTLVHFQYLLYTEPSKSTVCVCVCVCALALLGLGGVWTLLMSSNLCSLALSLSLTTDSSTHFLLHPSAPPNILIIRSHAFHIRSWLTSFSHFLSQSASASLA